MAPQMTSQVSPEARPPRAGPKNFLPAEVSSGPVTASQRVGRRPHRAARGGREVPGALTSLRSRWVARGAWSPPAGPREPEGSAGWRCGWTALPCWTRSPWASPKAPLGRQERRSPLPTPGRKWCLSPPVRAQRRGAEGLSAEAEPRAGGSHRQALHSEVPRLPRPGSWVARSDPNSQGAREATGGPSTQEARNEQGTVAGGDSRPAPPG